MGAFVKGRTADKGIEKLLSERGIAYRSFLELGNMFREFDDWRGPYRELFDRAGTLLVGRLGELPEPFCLLLRREMRVAMPPPGDCRFPSRHQSLGSGTYRVILAHRSEPTFISSGKSAGPTPPARARAWPYLASGRAILHTQRQTARCHTRRSCR